MISETAVRIGAQRPRLARLPREKVSSSGHDAIEYAESLGYELDDWQRWCIENIFSEDRHRRLIATLILILVARQNGKNVILEVVELFCFYVLDWQTIYHTAHLQKTSAAHMARLRSIIEAHEELASITKIIEANGQERIERLDTRAQIIFVTRSNKIGRGPSPRLVVFDEARFLTDVQQQAIVPSMSAQSMLDDQPLMIFTSSAPEPGDLTLHRYRDGLLSGASDGFLADWGAEIGSNIRDRDIWAASNPGLNIRISEQWIESMELPFLTEEAFSIERLGIVFTADDTSGELPEWPGCLDQRIAIQTPEALAVDIALDLSWTSIAVAERRDDDKVAVEVIETLPGTAGAPAVLKRLTELYDVPVWLNPRSEAAGLLTELQKLEVRVEEISPLDYLSACVGLRQHVTNHLLIHRGQGPLDAAVAGAAVRAQGEGWVWAGRTSSTDISPLVAVTLAAWVARSGDGPEALALVL